MGLSLKVWNLEEFVCFPEGTAGGVNQKSGNDKKSVSASEGRTRASAGVGKSKTKNSGFRWRPGDYCKVHCREYECGGRCKPGGHRAKSEKYRFCHTHASINNGRFRSGPIRLN
ncbi:MAG: hypothetical protein ACXW39_00695, partial [Nitrospira sp.]